MFSPTDTLNYLIEQVVTSRIYSIWDGINSESDNLLDDLYDESVLVDTSFHQHQSYFNLYMYLLDSVIVQNLQMDIFTLSSMRWDWDVYCIFSVRFAMDCKGTSIWTTTKRTCFNHEFFTYFINCTFPDFFFDFFGQKNRMSIAYFFFTSDWMFWDFFNLNLFRSPVIIKTMIFF